MASRETMFYQRVTLALGSHEDKEEFLCVKRGGNISKGKEI